MKSKVDLVSMLLINVDGQSSRPIVKTRKDKGVFSWREASWECSDAEVRLQVLRINFSQFFLSGNFFMPFT